VTLCLSCCCCLFILYLLQLEYDRPSFTPPLGELVRRRSSHLLPTIPADKRKRKRKRRDRLAAPASMRHASGNFPTSMAARKSITTMSHIPMENSVDSCARRHRPAFQPVAFPIFHQSSHWTLAADLPSGCVWVRVPAITVSLFQFFGSTLKLINMILCGLFQTEPVQSKTASLGPSPVRPSGGTAPG